VAAWFKVASSIGKHDPTVSALPDAKAIRLIHT